MNKTRDSFFPENNTIQSIGEFSKQDIDLVNKYCAKFGYKPDFNRCHKIYLIKGKDNLLYALDTEHGLQECINDNFIMYNRMKKTCDKNGWNKMFDKALGNAFGLVSLKHSGSI